MTSYYVCADNIDGKERSRINALMEAMKKRGHSATSGGVGPNTVQSKGLNSSSSGMVGVFIVGGSDAGMYTDFRDGLKRGYYHYKHMKVVFASETATTDKWITCNGLANTPLVRAWDDNYSGSNIAAVGKTAKAFFDANKQYISYACGKKGCTFQDVINNFFSGSEDGSGDGSGGNSSSTIKAAIKDVLYGWNGEAYCYVEGETMHIGRIPSPTGAKLSLVEGDNVHFDSISLKDINPDTPNKLTVNLGGGKYTIQDDGRIKRFGEVAQTIQGNNTIEKDPVDAVYREWNKALKDGERVVECKVRGESTWRIGQWVRVYFPSYNIDGFMFVTKCSHSDDGDWDANLTLEDYPPDLGTKPQETESDEEGTEEESEEEI